MEGEKSPSVDVPVNADTPKGSTMKWILGYMTYLLFFYGMTSGVALWLGKDMAVMISGSGLFMMISVIYPILARVKSWWAIPGMIASIAVMGFFLFMIGNVVAMGVDPKNSAFDLIDYVIPVTVIFLTSEVSAFIVRKSYRIPFETFISQ